MRNCYGMVTRAMLLVTTGVHPALASGQAREAADSGAPGTLPWPAGVRFEVGYVGEVFQPLRGGRSQQAVYLDNLDLLLDVNLESLLHLRNTSLRFHVQSNRGRPVSAKVGDLQGLSNIEAPAEWRLFEAWFEYNAVPEHLSLLVGVYDVNSEVDVIPAAGNFVNSSFGFGPEYSLSGLNGPSTFPFTSVGIRLEARPLRKVYLGLVLTDGAPGVPDDPGRSRFALGNGEGVLFSWEAGFEEPVAGRVADLDGPPTPVQRGHRRIGRGHSIQNLRTKVALGGWAYSRRFPAWESGRPPGSSWGLYVLGERLIWCGTDKEGGLSVFMRAGMANDVVNMLGAYLGGGAAYTGPIPGRSDDVLGLAVAHARNGTPFMDAQLAFGDPRERAETVAELSYLLRPNELFQLQPNLQWVINPGMDPEAANAVVVGFRGSAALELP